MLCRIQAVYSTNERPADSNRHAWKHLLLNNASQAYHLLWENDSSEALNTNATVSRGNGRRGRNRVMQYSQELLMEQFAKRHKFFLKCNWIAEPEEGVEGQ